MKKILEEDLVTMPIRFPKPMMEFAEYAGSNCGVSGEVWLNCILVMQFMNMGFIERMPLNLPEDPLQNADGFQQAAGSYHQRDYDEASPAPAPEEKK